MLLALLIDGYTLVVFASVLISWVNPPEDHPAVRAIRAMTDPVLDPIRRVLPSMGGLDFSPMVLLIALQILRRFLFG